MEPSQMTPNDNMNELSNDQSEPRGSPPMIGDNVADLDAGGTEPNQAYGNGYRRPA